MTEAQARRWAPLVLLVVGAVLLFPALSSFGLWDPNEVRQADLSRGVMTHGTWGALVQLGRPPLTTWLVALGFRAFGVGELGGRLPIAAVSLLALFATYYAGSGFLRRRAALLGTLALATTPAFVLGGRQLITCAPALLGAALAVGGLGRAAWPAAEATEGRRLLDLLLGVVGLAVGLGSSGMLIGVVAPTLAVTLALASAAGPSGPMWIGGAASLASLGLTVYVYKQHVGYSPLLGGSPHPPVSATVVTSTLKQLGAALFPWIALFPFGAARALWGALPTRDGATPSEGPRAHFDRRLLVMWGLVTYLAATLQAAAAGEQLAPLGPVLCLFAGAFLDQLLDDAEPFPIAGLAVVLGVLILGRDFFVFPETFLSAHSLEPVRWPGPLVDVPYVFVGYAGLFAGAVGLAIGFPLRAAADGKRSGRELLVAATLASAVLMALTTSFVIVPLASRRLSARDLYGKARQLDPNAPLGQYRFNAQGASYYAAGRAPTNLATVKDLFDFLGRPERVFVMAGSDELAAINQAAREQKASYFVVDDSNSRFLVLSNRLGPKEQDKNPLKLYVSDRPSTTQHPVSADFDGKVELVGYDLPAQVDRGTDFRIRLHFKVVKPVGGNYKVFIHFDGPGARVNGDHTPLEGRFPTQNWVPGYYIIDEHTVKPDRAMQPAGFYQVYMGLFAGDQRMKVLGGPQDGDQRVKLGVVQFK